MSGSRLLGDHAVVVGAGIAGLMTAQVLSEFFSRVSILERDQPCPTIQARRGVPQGKHVHILLARGEQVLTKLFPGIDADLEALGAVRLRIGYDVIAFEEGEIWPRRELGIICHAQSRPLLEHCIRNRVADVENVTIKYGCRVNGPLASADSQSITGVECQNQSRATHKIKADLVLDTSGRYAQAPEWLTQLGYQTPDESSVEVDVSYSTALFDIPQSHTLSALGIAVRGLPSTANRGGYLQTIEGNRWIVTLTGRHEDHPPTDRQGFVAYTKSLQTPEIYHAIRDLVPVGKIQQHRFTTSLLHHYEKLSRFPKRLLALGDAICSINPIYAHGISSAAKQVEFLQAALNTMADGGMGWENLAGCFFQGAADAVSSGWSQSCEADLAYSQTLPMNQMKKFARRRAYTTTLRRIAMVDPEVHRRIVQVMNLLEPVSVLTEDNLRRRVMTELTARPTRKVAA